MGMIVSVLSNFWQFISLIAYGFQWVVIKLLEVVWNVIVWAATGLLHFAQGLPVEIKGPLLFVAVIIGILALCWAICSAPQLIIFFCVVIPVCYFIFKVLIGWFLVFMMSYILYSLIKKYIIKLRNFIKSKQVQKGNA